MLEQNLINKNQNWFKLFVNCLAKWRNDLTFKKSNHIKLLQTVLDSLDIQQC